MASAPEPIAAVPAPWTLKGTIYSFMMYITATDAKQLSEERSFLYAPLEANSEFANGKPVGGLGMVQIIRHSESPVGSYDELVMVPGNFEHEVEVEGKDGKKRFETRKNLRVTRIYVSQEKTCWNGRKNWNIPKHLARFHFEDLPNGAVAISVYPLELNNEGVEAVPCRTPFFSATYKPIAHTPSFPASTDWAKYLGMDLSLVAPPLPQGKGALGELPGTDEWCKVLPYEYSSKTTLGWWDLKRGAATEEDALLGGGDADEQMAKGEKIHENWWPGLGRWRIGLKMEDAKVVFAEGNRWVGES